MAQQVKMRANQAWPPVQSQKPMWKWKEGADMAKLSSDLHVSTMVHVPLCPSPSAPAPHNNNK